MLLGYPSDMAVADLCEADVPFEIADLLAHVGESERLQNAA
jgi:hypothetical protein